MPAKDPMYINDLFTKSSCVPWTQFLWLALHIFVTQQDTNRDTLVSLRPETRDVDTHASGRKWVRSTELDIVNGSVCNLCALALGLTLYISSLRSAEKSQEGLNSCPLLRFCFIGSLHVGVSKRFCRSISLAVYRLSLYIFLTHQISFWSYVGSVHRMRSLAVSGLMTKKPYIASTAIPDPRSPVHVRLSLGILFTTAQFFLHTLQLANEII